MDEAQSRLNGFYKPAREYTAWDRIYFAIQDEERRKAIKKNGFYQRYLRSEWWRKRRQEYLESHENVCFRCERNDHLELHHLSYERLFGEIDSDLRLLCRECHQAEHTE